METLIVVSFVVFQLAYAAFIIRMWRTVKQMQQEIVGAQLNYRVVFVERDENACSLRHESVQQIACS